MKHDNEIERILGGLPSRGLPSGADERIEQAMSTASLLAQSPQPEPWWSRGVPLWLAAAACLAMSAATALLAPRTPGPTPDPVVAQTDTDTTQPRPGAASPVTASAGPRIDIARWRILDVRTESSS